MLHVLVADDHGIVRSGLRMLLEQQGDIEVIAEVSDGATARDVAIRERPDLAILDVKMPKLDGIEAARRILAERPIPIVMVTAYGQHELVARAVDTAANSQPESPASTWNFKGYANNACPRVSVVAE